MPIFRRQISLPLAPTELYDWHMRAGAFQRLVPPWEAVRMVDSGGGVSEGSRATPRVSIGPVSRQWIAEHRNLRRGEQFVDVQVRGPFARWQHTHRMLSPESGCAGSILEDEIDYQLPAGAVGERLAGAHVVRQLERMFRYRHAIMQIDLARHAQARGRTMKVLVTGASGLVGRSLVSFLTTGGHRVTCLGRAASKMPGTESRTWNPDAGQLNPQDVDGFDAVVHLAGENIAGGRWTKTRKQRIQDSRVRSTSLLAAALAQVQKPPEVLVSASALGYYGDRGDSPLPENSPPGAGFLPEVCVAWEAATATASARGIRVVHPRISLVLSPAGGALASMLPIFKLGLGGCLGNGRQYMSWITVDDLVGVIHHALITPGLSGPVNAASPYPVTNQEFTKTLGKVLHRPTITPVPRFAARLAMGEMADALLFASTRLVPERLAQTGFMFAHPQLEPALRHVLGR